MALTGRVLITGGTGFLGRGIMRKAQRENWDCEFTILSRDEYKQDVCQRQYPSARYVLGDIRDTEKLELVMTGHNLVIHAGAIKYITQAEQNVNECIDINVYGSRCVINAARHAGVKRVIGISTDKACSPVNVYGMTKALMERQFVEATRDTEYTTYVCCRYGNVVGSTGSVIPLFQRQLNEQGVVTVTNGSMTRYFISIDEAVKLIEVAADEPVSGTIVIPQPKSMRIDKLAAVITNGNPSLVQFIGERQGEKLHEDMIAGYESRRTVMCDDGYYRMYPASHVPQLYSPFHDSSDQAIAITSDEMEAMIEDAYYV